MLFVAGLLPTVDSTVTTEVIVDHLLMRLPAGRNELVLFDINRGAAIEPRQRYNPLPHRTSRLQPFADFKHRGARPPTLDPAPHGNILSEHMRGHPRRL